MDSQTRAEKIAALIRSNCADDCEPITKAEIEAIAAQIEAVQREALAERGSLFQANVENFPNELKEARKDAYADGFKAGEERAIKAGGIIAKQVYDKGFNAAREKAKGIFETIYTLRKL